VRQGAASDGPDQRRALPLPRVASVAGYGARAAPLRSSLSSVSLSARCLKDTARLRLSVSGARRVPDFLVPIIITYSPGLPVSRARAPGPMLSGPWPPPAPPVELHPLLPGGPSLAASRASSASGAAGSLPDRDAA
jgi:hypothetical protein